MALEIRPADEMKIAIIEYLISEYPGVIIGNEVMYGTTRKVVDLLALYNGETYAIEVKSEKDDMRRLPEQLKEYSLIFDHTYVFTHPKHVENVKSLVQSKVSVFVVDNGVVSPIKISQENNRTTKQEMLYSINSSYIRKTLQLPSSLDSDSIRGRIMRSHKKDEIHSILYGYLEEKLSNSYNLLTRDDKGDISIDDLSVLSSRLNL